MTKYWADELQQSKNPPFFEEFGMDVVRAAATGDVMGCGFRSVEQAERWFNPEERVRMRLLGYRFGWLDVDRIAAESDRQLVFVRRLPLARHFHELKGAEA